MGIQDIIADDDTSVVSIEGVAPISVQAVYTAPGGTVETAVTLFFSDIPLHGDEQQNYEVEQESIYAVGKPSDISSWVING